MTFTLVDRITALTSPTHARGAFTVPRGGYFPPCLVAEAIGQLAAWVAMAWSDFRLRPLAALAAEARFVGAVIPGAVLDLGVDIAGCDRDVVAYSGWARVGDTPIVVLERCVGRMLPLADFDAPDAARARFEGLCAAGLPADRLCEIVPPRFTSTDRGDGRARAVMDVPEQAPFFSDHFPRRAVFPATLLIDAQMRLAGELVPQTTAVRVTDVKLRSFILPGQRVETAATMSSTPDATVVAFTAAVSGKRVASARVHTVAAERS